MQPALPDIGAPDETHRLLPATLEDRLVKLIGRAGGVALLGALALVWFSLLTWSVTDPSLTFATGGRTQNGLGPLGAIVSDLLLQMLGFATAVSLLAPMFWGLELTLRERVPAFRSKISFYPLSVVLIAGGLSTLPTGDNWPLHHGLGGILGDVLANVGASLFSIVNPERANVASGLVFFATGVSSLLTSLGLEIGDIKRMIEQAEPQRAASSAFSRFWHRASAGPQPANEPAFDSAGPYPAGFDHAGYNQAAYNQAWPSPQHAAAYPMAAQHGWPADDTGHGHDSGHPMPPHAVYAYGYPPGVDEPMPQFVQQYAAAQGVAPAYPHGLGAPGPAAHHAPAHPAVAHPSHAYDPRAYGALPYAAPIAQPMPEPHGDRELMFDATTDTASRDIAERFAPSHSDARALAVEAPQAAAAHAVAAQAVTAKPAKPGSGLLGGFAFRRAAPAYKRPSLNLLKRAAASRQSPELSQTALRGSARLLEDTLADFGVKGEVRDIKPGPVVTLFEMEPARGTKSARVIGLADDIARSMSAQSVRVAVVPGRNAMGIELPNARRETVYLREILESDAFKSGEAILPVALGKGIGGEPIVADLARMPHLLVAGTTGSGKSVGVNAMILSLLYRHSPDDCRMIMIDPKMLELSVYNGIPHLLTPVVTDPAKAVAALNWAVGEMEERYKRMAQLNVRNIDVFNNRVRNAKKRGEMMSRTVQTGFDKRGQAVYEKEDMDLETMPMIVIVVDEFADLMIVAGKEIEGAVQRLAQMARAAGIHLIMATQRPSVDIITGTIKANFPTRISFKVTSKIDSRTILNDQGAEQLLGQGDMLYSTGAGQTARVHGPFVSDEEVESIAAFLRQQGEPAYVTGITEPLAATGMDAAGGETRAVSDDDLYDRAVAVVLRDRKASTSYIQRRLSIGYNRAADLMERMEREGLVTPAGGSGKREILAGDPGKGADAA